MYRMTLWLVFVGCGTVVEEVEDGGQVCLPAALIADTPPTLTYLESCMSGSLQEVDLSCSAALAGDVLTVATRLSYERPRSGETTADCREYQATCDGPALAEGSYTVRFAGEDLDLVVPGSFDPVACLGGP
jgi:hypothetical protein